MLRIIAKGSKAFFGAVKAVAVRRVEKRTGVEASQNPRNAAALFSKKAAIPSVASFDRKQASW
jgi:hypothetical protein